MTGAAWALGYRGGSLAVVGPSWALWGLDSIPGPHQFQEHPTCDDHRCPQMGPSVPRGPKFLVRALGDRVRLSQPKTPPAPAWPAPPKPLSLQRSPQVSGPCDTTCQEGLSPRPQNGACAAPHCPPLPAPGGTVCVSCGSALGLVALSLSQQGAPTGPGPLSRCVRVPT